MHNKFQQRSEWLVCSDPQRCTLKTLEDEWTKLVFLVGNLEVKTEELCSS